MDRLTLEDLTEANEQVFAFAKVAKRAAELGAIGCGDDLVVLPNACPDLPGQQDDDGVRAVAAIEVLRLLVEAYDTPTNV